MSSHTEWGKGVKLLYKMFSFFHDFHSSFLFFSSKHRRVEKQAAYCQHSLYCMCLLPVWIRRGRTTTWSNGETWPMISVPGREMTWISLTLQFTRATTGDTGRTCRKHITSTDKTKDMFDWHKQQVLLCLTLFVYMLDIDSVMPCCPTETQ